MAAILLDVLTKIKCEIRFQRLRGNVSMLLRLTLYSIWTVPWFPEKKIYSIGNNRKMIPGYPPFPVLSPKLSRSPTVQSPFTHKSDDPAQCCLMSDSSEGCMVTWGLPAHRHPSSTRQMPDTVFMRILRGILYSQLHVQGRLAHAVAICSHKCLHKQATQIFTQYVHIRKWSLKLNFHWAVRVGKGMEPNQLILEAYHLVYHNLHLCWIHWWALPLCSVLEALAS